MAFKLKKTSDNLFHKVSESKLDGGKVTQQPQVNMEAPSSVAKLTGPLGTGILGAAAGYLAKKVFGGSKKPMGENGPAKPPQKKDLSMTPYSSKDGKGTIHGPKVSYDMAYNKAKKTKQYANMSKDEYITEAKRQTANFKKTGKWDAGGASKPRKKVEAVSAIKPASIQANTAKPTATIEIKKPTVEKKETSKKASKLREKGNKVLSDNSLSTEEKQRKALSIRKKYNKQNSKVEKKAKVKTAKVGKIEARANVAEAKGNNKRAERLRAKAERKETGMSRKDQGRNIFGGKTRKQKKKEAEAKKAGSAPDFSGMS